jgi:hypothetical protein
MCFSLSINYRFFYDSKRNDGDKNPSMPFIKEIWQNNAMYVSLSI